MTFLNLTVVFRGDIDVNKFADEVATFSSMIKEEEMFGLKIEICSLSLRGVDNDAWVGREIDLASMAKYALRDMISSS